MKGAGLVLLAWAVMVSALTIVLWTIFSTEAQQVGMLGASIVAVVLTGLFLLARRRVAPEGDPDEVRAIPELSVSTGWLALAFVLLLLALEFGYWLALIAGGMLAIGAFGAVTEARGARRALERRGGTATGGEGGASGVEDARTGRARR